MESLFDKLLKCDAKKADELETSIYYSWRLAKILGSDEAVPITLQELPYERLNDLMSRQFDKKGNRDWKKGSRANAIVCAEGIIDPKISDPQICEHFGCPTPADAVTKIFSMELLDIVNEICKLSGFNVDEDSIEEEAEEIKN